MDIQTEQDDINIRGVPVFVLPCPAGGDILFGLSEQQAIGMAMPQEILASRSRVIGGSVTARDPLERTGELVAAAGSQVLKMLKLKVVGEKEHEEISEDDEESDRYDSDSTTTLNSIAESSQSVFRPRGWWYPKYLKILVP